MPTMSSVSRVKIGGSLAEIVEVISCSATQERQVADRGVAMKLAEERYYGKHSVSGSLSVVYNKTDQTLIEDQIAGALASIAMQITWESGAVWSGPVKFTRHTPSYQTNQLVSATIDFVSDGAWIINGRNTETLATS
jgi:hypothetical protein